MPDQKILIAPDRWDRTIRYSDSHLVRALGNVESKEAEQESLKTDGTRLAADGWPALGSDEGIVCPYLYSRSKFSISQRIPVSWAKVFRVSESSSVTFDGNGTRLAVTMLHWYPMIYALSDPYPLATCTGRNGPDGNLVPAGERMYSNQCTMKRRYSYGGMVYTGVARCRRLLRGIVGDSLRTIGDIDATLCRLNALRLIVKLKNFLYVCMGSSTFLTFGRVAQRNVPTALEKMLAET
ncbi:hypothetical protein EDC04DRAFT_2606285 [Pisolithus marmoratus]|nr:hypothetical protein EDC04DRAFT_2606285 [Pisolithus marmoratus]